MTITDHLNLTGSSPLDGPVFTDVRSVWDDELADVLRGVTERSGVYAAVRGPEYQTMAETRMLESAGADCVGMSFAQAPTDPDEVVRLAAGAHTTIAAGTEAVLAAMS